MATNVSGVDGTRLVLTSPIDGALPAGIRVSLREGCDRTIATCSNRFGNGVNFRGEPYLPGNDLITRYAAPGQ
ncbi:MAG: phage BR0599 family protein [Pseudomonadota bacterium]